MDTKLLKAGADATMLPLVACPPAVCAQRPS